MYTLLVTKQPHITSISNIIPWIMYYILLYLSDSDANHSISRYWHSSLIGKWHHRLIVYNYPSSDSFCDYWYILKCFYIHDQWQPCVKQCIYVLSYLPQLVGTGNSTLSQSWFIILQEVYLKSSLSAQTAKPMEFVALTIKLLSSSALLPWKRRGVW